MKSVMPSEAGQSTQVGVTALWTPAYFCVRVRYPGYGSNSTHT